MGSRYSGDSIMKGQKVNGSNKSRKVKGSVGASAVAGSSNGKVGSCTGCGVVISSEVRA